MNWDFDWQIDEFMVYCRSKQLREKSMLSYEQGLRLFQRWCAEQMNIKEVDKVTESVIRRYISDILERGKYTFYAVEKQKETNHPDRRRDYRNQVSVVTINSYIRRLRVFFNWLYIEGELPKNPMKRIRQLKENRKAKEYIKDEDFKKLICFRQNARMRKYAHILSHSRKELFLFFLFYIYYIIFFEKIQLCDRLTTHQAAIGMIKTPARVDGRGFERCSVEAVRKRFTRGSALHRKRKASR